MRIILLIALFPISLTGCNEKSNQNETKEKSSIKMVSERWKKDHRISDFRVLRSHLRPGALSDEVELLLGEPMGHTQDNGKEFYEYIDHDVAQKKYVWNAVFDSERNLIEWIKESPSTMLNK